MEWLAGFVVYVLFLVGLFGGAIWRPAQRWFGAGPYSRKRKRAVVFSSGAVSKYDTARASSAMLPELEPFVREGSILHLTGSVGEYLSKNDAYYKTLRDWAMERRSCINYILVMPDPKYVGVFLELEKETGRRFRVFTVHPDDFPDNYRSIIRRLRTYHPSIVETTDDKRAMWLEGYHPPTSMVAYDVEFIDLQKNRSPGRLEQFLRIREVLHKIVADVDNLKAETASEEEYSAAS